MYEFPLLFPERVADATIRGFLYQVLRTVLQWLDVEPDEVLLCEGDEDLDRCLFDGTKLKWTEQQQYKDYLSRNLSARHPAVYESLFNFMMSFEHHHRAGRGCRFIFLTTTGIASQECCEEIPEDILSLWKKISADSDRLDKSKLTASLKGLVEKYKAAFIKKKSDSAQAGKFEAAIWYIEQNSLWDLFISSVEWNFDEPDGKHIAEELARKLRSRPRLSGASEEVVSLFAARLEVEVLRKSSQRDIDQRILTKAILGQILDSTSQELITWAHVTGLENLAQEIGNIKSALCSVQSDVVNIKHRLPISLAEATELSLQYLAQRARIIIKEMNLSINRISSSALADWVVLGSCIVIGEPGIGKSAMLYFTAKTLIEKGYDVVVLTVDKFLKQFHLTDELIRWQSEKQGFIMIDGLDAERGERNSLYEKLETLSLYRSKWFIVASMRRFDLENDSRIQRFFVGQPHPDYCPSQAALGQAMKGVRYFEINGLIDTELKEVREKSADIDKIISQASVELLDLLRNPFNLALAVEIASDVQHGSDLTVIKTQTELLSKSWDLRISLDTPQYRFSRESVLRKLCNKMMEIPALEIPATHLDDDHFNWDRFSDLMHSGLIVRHANGFLEFSHNILFDYAISRYWLADESNVSHLNKTIKRELLLTQLEQYGDLILLIYPSFELYFVQLWEKDSTRNTFWNCVITLAGSAQISPVLLVAPAMVAACLARLQSDLWPLCKAIEDGSEAAHKTLQRLVSALDNLPLERSVRINGSPWCALAEWLAGTKEPLLWDAARRLLWILTPVEQQQDSDLSATVLEPILTDEEKDAAHNAALAYFDHISGIPTHNLRLFGVAIQILCRNAAKSPVKVFDRLRNLVTPEQLSMYGYVVVPALAKSLRWLLSFDTAFVKQFFIIAFQNQNNENEESIRYGGSVQGLGTNRKQEYDMGLYELENQYNILLDFNPIEATQVLITILVEKNLAERRRHWEFQLALRKQAEEVELPEVGPELDYVAIQLGTYLIRFQRDYSGMAEELSDHYAYESKILNIWSEWVSKAVRNNDSNIIEVVFATLAKFNHLEILWMHFLRISTLNPDVIGLWLIPLAINPFVFTSAKRQKDVGIFLRQTWPLLSDVQRASVEEQFQSFVDNPEHDAAPEAAYLRDKIFAYVYAKSMTLPPLKPSRRGGIISVSRRERRRREAVTVQAEPKLHRRVVRVKRWADKRDDLTRLSADQLPLQQIRGDMHQLHSVLILPEINGDHNSLQEDGWGYLAAVSAHLVQREDVLSHVGLLAQLRVYLLGAASCAAPRPRTDEPLPAGTMMSYGFPSARIHAAVGLCSLSWKCADPEQQVLKTVEQMAIYDANSIVRWHITGYAQHIHFYHPYLSAKYIEHMTHQETSGAVVANWLKSGVLWKIAHQDIDSAISILNEIVYRFAPISSSLKSEDAEMKVDQKNEIVQISIDCYISWYVRYSHPYLKTQLENFLSHPWLDGAQLIPHHLHNEAVDGLAEPENLEKRNIREMSWVLLNKLCESALLHLKELMATNPPANSAAGHRCLGVQALLNNLAKMAWHHLEAFAQEQIRDGKENIKLSPLPLRVGFFKHAQPILAMLATLPFPAIADELVKALSGAIDFAAKDVLLLASQSVSSAISFGYATDRFGALTVSKFVRRYLSEQRILLQEDKESRDALLRILAPFVDVGWPEMQKIVFRLAASFR